MACNLSGGTTAIGVIIALIICRQYQIHVQGALVEGRTDELCSDSRDDLPQDVFRIRACTNCFRHLHAERYAKEFYARANGTLMQYLSVSKGGSTSQYAPDIRNDSSVAPVCELLGLHDCENWKLCCTKADECCERQKQFPPKSDNQYCKRTWDGYTCWDDTLAASAVHKPCPNFMYTIDRPASTRFSTKTCHPNGTWFSKNGGLSHWTDYTMCPNVEGQWTVLYISMSTNIASVSLLIPAIVIFLSYRLQSLFSSDGAHLSLRRQHRVKVHTNFFFSLLLCAMCQVLWDILLTQNALNSSVTGKRGSRLEDNSVECRVLSASKIYFSSTNYFWMFCEGYYLHRLLSDAFRPPENLIPLYIIGWVLPMIPVVIYSIIRVFYSNKYCWVYSYGEFSWIYYLPNMLCLIVNLLFLCNILRVITSRLQCHPNEPSNFRKGLKAVFVLIPLFGLQLFVTIYRPPHGSQGLSAYDAFHSFITNSQGFFVALIFCFFNKEVMNHVKITWFCCRLCCPRAGYYRHTRQCSYANSFSTEGTVVSSRSSPRLSATTQTRQTALQQSLRENIKNSAKYDECEGPIPPNHKVNWNNKNGTELLVSHAKAGYITLPIEGTGHKKQCTSL
ncbi:calcitonin gene-related peptide type 1 receptor-like [Tubulanus polymorphus]|uniref:calcitonin gene-related peptide type 1 receptor-like n=1 Tax=Tubulanus polymorphus TaxID=672921 RepID=UPI003DA2C342